MKLLELGSSKGNRILAILEERPGTGWERFARKSMEVTSLNSSILAPGNRASSNKGIARGPVVSNRGGGASKMAQPSLMYKEVLQQKTAPVQHRGRGYESGKITLAMDITYRKTSQEPIVNHPWNHSTAYLHDYDKEERGQRIPLSKTTGTAKKTNRATIHQN